MWVSKIMKLGIYNLHQEKGVLLYGVNGVITARFVRKPIISEDTALLINCNNSGSEQDSDTEED